MEKYKGSKPRDGILMAISIVCSSALMLWAGFSGADKAYLYAVVLICVFILVPFYISFEKDRPYAREIVLVSVMVALAVASRAAFFWIPQFKPIIAVVIIAGVGMGAREGFVTGSMSAFVSNFIFGQGPWTPFQMVAWGLIGFFAGMIFGRYYREQGASADQKEKPLYPLLIYGAACCFVLHGAITDLWTALSISDRPTLGILLTVYSAGLIPDAVLASATVLFLAIGTRPMLAKLWRVQRKYGL